MRALEGEYAQATTEASRLEQSRASSLERARTDRWGSDFHNVEQTRAEAGSASVFRRRAAEEAHEAARRKFLEQHGHEPTPEPPAQLREKWRRDSTAPGSDPRLDDARRRAAGIRKSLDELQKDPAPQRPAKPAPGTPEQEAAKDARYVQRKAQRAQQETTKAPSARTPRDRAPRSRGPER